MLTNNDVYVTIRDAIDIAADERGRSFEVAHEAHYMAVAVLKALAEAGYTITRRPEG